MVPPKPIPMEELLAQADWARRLARTLVRDPHAADDLVQRTWVAALEHPPAEHATRLRGWLASVMRNFARQDARAGERRTRHESHAARPEGSDEVETGIELQQRLLELLRTLAEPYRGALYARYFEGLGPRAIAQRDGLPLKTVKSRLTRGLALLRERLDREHGGDRRAWMAWIAPLAVPSNLPLGILGVLLVDTKIKLAAGLAAAVCALAVGVHFARQDLQSPPPGPVLAASAPQLEQPPQHLLPSDENAEERVGVAPPPRESELRPLIAAPPEAVLRGRVIDLDNRAVSGVRIAITLSAQTPSAIREQLQVPEDLHSDELGEFEFKKIVANGQLAVDDQRWVTVFKPQLNSPWSTGLLAIVVAPRLDFAGVVVDAQHRPIPGAQVELLPSASIKRKLELGLEGAISELFEAQCDEAGRFLLAGVPACDAQFRANANGFAPGTLAAPTLSASNLEIVLAAREQRPAIVRGLVLDAQRVPLEGAMVALGGQSQVTEMDGRFEFDLDADVTAQSAVQLEAGLWGEQYPRDRVRAAKAGLLPADVELPSIAALREEPLPHELTLVLTGEPLTISGKVIASGGGEVGRVQVSVLNETPFGVSYDRHGEAMVARETSVEALLRGGVHNGRKFFDSEFELRGLTQRAYDLVALDTKSLRTTVLRNVPAGSRGVIMELPGDASLRHVAGRVVSHSGVGVVGVSLHFGRVLESAQYADIARSVETDKQGRFDLGRIDPTDLRVQVIGEDTFLLMQWQPPQGTALDDLKIVVSQRCSVRVELSSTNQAADAFAFLDGSGAPTQNLRFEGTMLTTPQRCPIVGGRSEVFATEDSARTLLLFQDGKEVARMPVQLDPAKLVVLRP